jgi:hypothetical protein
LGITFLSSFSLEFASLSSLRHPIFLQYMIKHGLASKKQVEEEIKAWFGGKRAKYQKLGFELGT